MSENTPELPDFTRWPSFPFEGDMRVKQLAPDVEVEPPRSGEDAADCLACATPDDSCIWVSERWRVRAMESPTGLPMVLILECRSHLDLGDLPNLLAAELGVMTVRLERAIRSVDGVARVHVNRWGDGSAHLQMWFLARPYGRLQLRGTFLSLWNDILPVVPEEKWRESLAHVAAWLGEFGGRAIAEPPHIHWQAPATFSEAGGSTPPAETDADPVADLAADTAGPVETFDDGGMRDLAAYAKQDAHPLHPTTTTPTATTRAEPGPPAFEPIGTARTEPFGTESVGTESAATEPAATGPVGTESVGTESAATGSVGIESVGTESVEIAPAATEPIATEAAVTVVAAIGPCATGLVGADPSEPDR